MNANVPIRVIVTDPEKIDAVLPLAAPTIPLHRPIIEQASPQHDRGALEGLLVGRLWNLGGGEKRHKRRSPLDAQLAE
ncbi:hypothetical protein CN311_28815 [Mesorhizobium sanjuanii]|uniref:Uncharacterized protein n=1 Tax=Mesorhizobium sanjuanii TaxID=2037900 RepID=A0A2A6F7A2_9HYPH|nr:hypothetical protein CN311_28815 [Mesorhizobium sanjuanii]